MAIKHAPTVDEAQEYYRELQERHLVALWNVQANLLVKEPRSRAVPYLWRWGDLYPLIERSGEVAPPLQWGAERRVLGLINPGLPERYGATHTMWAGFQYLMPGEVAPAHRHSVSAIRFIVQGEGGFTAVDGDRCIMGPGDLILTPPWTWHDHGNETDEPMIWLDGLNLQLVADLEAVFYEPFSEDAQPLTRPVGDSEGRYSVGQLRPSWEKPVGPCSPLLNYKWAQAEEALRRLATADSDPFDDVAMEYINPHTGGPIMPGLACGIQLIRGGVRTRAHRHTGSVIYLAFQGSGSSVIDGQRFHWEKGDLFVVPTWAWHEHAGTDGEAVLFSVQDRPAVEALGLYREQAYQDHGGHQPITRIFGG